MNYQQFVSAVEVRIKQQVKEGMSVCIQTTMKNNGKNRVGIMVSEKGNQCIADDLSGRIF